MVKSISIVTINRNHPDGLKRTGDSLAAQKNCDFANDIEWLIVDGSDKKFEQVKDIVWNYGPLVSQFHTGANQGIYPALNLGLEHATGKYQWYMNAGDMFAKENTLETVLAVVKNNPAVDFIYGDYTNSKRNRKAVRPENYHAKRMITCHQSMVFRSDKLADLRYSQDYSIASDYLFMIEFLKKSKQMYYIPETLSCYESGGVSQVKYIQGAMECFDVRKRSGQVSFKENAKATTLLIAAGFVREISPGLFNKSREIYEKAFRKTPGHDLV